MRIFFACIAMCILLLSVASAQAHASINVMDVSRSDGSVQCGTGPKISLDEAVAEVEAAGVSVFGARTAHDGRKRIAMCGASTGHVHVLSINSEDFGVVEELGFEDFSEIRD